MLWVDIPNLSRSTRGEEALSPGEFVPYAIEIAEAIGKIYDEGGNAGVDSQECEQPVEAE